MNTRLLYFLLFVQFVFAGSLIYLGTQVREKRRKDYLDLTHRVTSGRASQADFEKLLPFVPERAEKPEIRALFGCPLLRAQSVELEEEGKRTSAKGESWLYYFAAEIRNPENPPAPPDISDTEKLTGPQPCFIVTFNERGRATARVARVIHPLKP
jgi:hypothetical protein